VLHNDDAGMKVLKLEREPGEFRPVGRHSGHPMDAHFRFQW
jgi:hypothetical protein